MKKLPIALILVIAAILIFLSGCIFNNNQGQDDLQYYKGITTAKLPDKCISFSNDICGLFSCMVDQCWCAPTVPSAILAEGKTEIKTEADAVAAVQQYVNENSSGYTKNMKAAKLNNIFWNVFAYNSENDEKVFTVAADGAIIATMCGV
ncbi:MAG: hypothetical protein COT15_00310 [Candidatus Diapherotrites archaeon CG08_land_8_20_14_0_20_34_12]|nr:MAG: hypothetical protein COT15_00310 [Candidatus Diapherotrites archaeon CG08_land_8_20_14_0_20_34_12]